MAMENHIMAVKDLTKALNIHEFYLWGMDMGVFG